MKRKKAREGTPTKNNDGRKEREGKGKGLAKTEGGDWSFDLHQLLLSSFCSPRISQTAS